jgi:hypothetical protein
VRDCRRADPAEVETAYHVRGSVLEEGSGRPLGGLLVRLYDRDLLGDGCLGETRTDPAGRFEIVFSEVQFMDVFETRPDLYLVVFDAEGAKLLHTTEDRVCLDAGPDEVFELRIPRGRVAQG